MPMKFRDQIAGLYRGNCYKQDLFEEFFALCIQNNCFPILSQGELDILAGF